MSVLWLPLIPAHFPMSSAVVPPQSAVNPLEAPKRSRGLTTPKISPFVIHGVSFPLGGGITVPSSATRSKVANLQPFGSQSVGKLVQTQSRHGKLLLVLIAKWDAVLPSARSDTGACALPRSQLRERATASRSAWRESKGFCSWGGHLRL